MAADYSFITNIQTQSIDDNNDLHNLDTDKINNIEGLYVGILRDWSERDDQNYSDYNIKITMCQDSGDMHMTCYSKVHDAPVSFCVGSDKKCKCSLIVNHFRHPEHINHNNQIWYFTY